MYMNKKLKNYYSIYCNFNKVEMVDTVIEFAEGIPQVIKDIEVTDFLIDPSNLNTHIIRFRDVNSGKSVVVCGDFKNYDGEYEKNKLEAALEFIADTDYLVMEGKYLGKFGPDYSSRKSSFR